MTAVHPDPDSVDGVGFEHEDDWHLYGAPHARLFVTNPIWDGQMAIAPRRPELLDDGELAGWWTDLRSWSTWAIVTFRLGRWFPPCWPTHPALVEELTALWLGWQATWLPANDPSMPALWLRELECSLARIERLWRVPCTLDEHKPAPDLVTVTNATDPELHRWWTPPPHPDQGDPAWP